MLVKTYAIINMVRHFLVLHFQVVHFQSPHVRDGCLRGSGHASGEQMSGHVMLTGGHGLWTTETAAVGPQSWTMRDVSVIGSQLKSTKLPKLYRIVPDDSLPRPPPPPVM